MRTIVQLSDLHFGRVDPALLDPLVDVVAGLHPDLVAVCGDLTQRARNAQFREARKFLDRLPEPRVVVPGNHDVPLYDVVRRFAAPLRRFCRHVSPDLSPFHHDGEIAVAGVNTARSLTFKGGRINLQQVEEVTHRFAVLGPSVLRIVVTHHPFDLPASGRENELVGRAAMAMRAFAANGVDLFLSGHLHRTHASRTAQRYDIDGYSGLVVQAGTATSTRGRGEANSFNVIRAARPDLAVESWQWQPARGTFACVRTRAFRHGPDGWSPAR